MSKQKSIKGQSNNQNGKRLITAQPQQLDITLYQGGMGVVRESRQFDLSESQNLVQLDQLPDQFAPDSLTILDVETAGNGKFNPGSLCYRRANRTLDAILKASIGKEISVIQLSNSRLRTTGKLLGMLGNQAILEDKKDKKITLIPIDSQLELEELPAGLSESSSLIMEPIVTEAGAYTIKLSYETGGVGWQARYTALYDEPAQMLRRFDCFVRLSNESGARFENARLKLLAASNGSSNRGYRAAALSAARSMDSFEAGSPGGAGAENVGEKHMYTLPGTWTLENGEAKQVCLFSASNVPVKGEYYLPRGRYEQIARQEDLQKQPVYLRLRLTNHADQNLGVALPAGQVNIFQPDSTGSQQKTESLSLDHVAAGEKFKLEPQTGCADLKATRRLVAAQEDPKPVEDSGTTLGQSKDEKPRYRTERREVTVYNYKKDRAVTVLVHEDVCADSELIEPSQKPLHAAKSELVYELQVAPGSSASVSYTTKFRIN